MRFGTLLLALTLSAGMAFAQAAQSTAPPAGQQGSRQAQRQQRRAEHQQQMQQHMQEAQAKIDKLKADIAKVSDSATKQALQDEADMWQMMLDHMKSMGGGMAGHPGMMGHHDMKGMQGGTGCAGMASPPPK